jgi:hypothetical protein
MKSSIAAREIGVCIEWRLLETGLGSTRTEIILEEHMIFEALRLRSGRGTPGAALPKMTAFSR